MEAAQIIAEARRVAGITQTELAARMGTHQSVVARWELGKTQPSLETVARAVAAAGFALEIAIGGKPAPPARELSPRQDDNGILGEMRRLHAEQARLRWIKGR